MTMLIIGTIRHGWQTVNCIFGDSGNKNKFVLIKLGRWGMERREWIWNEKKVFSKFLIMSSTVVIASIKRIDLVSNRDTMNYDKFEGIFYS